MRRLHRIFLWNLACVLLLLFVPQAAASSLPEADSAVSAVTSLPESTVSDREFINTEPYSTLPKQEPAGLSTMGVLAWAVIVACALALVLFVSSVRRRDKQAFRSRSAARSRWRRGSPTRSEMAERYYHDRSHFRK